MQNVNFTLTSDDDSAASEPEEEPKNKVTRTETHRIVKHGD